MANVGYIRVSTTDQHTDRQLAGVQLDKVFTDKVSGKGTDRPGLQAMLEYVREGDTVHVHEISRLARNTADPLAIVEGLTARKVAVQFHKEGISTGEGSAVGNLVLTLLASVAQMERELMLERQREGYAAAKAAGRIAGRGKGKAIDRSAVLADLAGGDSIRTVATRHGISTRTVQNIKAEANQAG